MNKQNTTSLGCGWTAICAACYAQFHAVSTKQNVCSSECRFVLYEGKSSKDMCWEWQGPINNQGYGVLFLNQNNSNGKRKVVSAHRYSYQKYVGVLPDGLCVMHRCDNRCCTNPAHLMLGTWAENNADRSAKGRSGKRVYTEAEKNRYSQLFRGQSNATAKLTDAMAAEIKYDRTLGCMKAAKKYGVSTSTIKSIRAGRAWTHI